MTPRTEEPAPAIRAEFAHVRRRPRSLWDDVTLATDDMPPPVKWQEGARV
jgi:hypothetical protein